MIHFMRRIATVVMKIESRCYKLKLPNGKVVDILSEVIDEISKWLQCNSDLPESGGYILGYQHRQTGNITLELVTSPHNGDIRNRIRCIIKDVFHGKILRIAQLRNSYYMGVWHTHPQLSPTPSTIDLQDWEQSLRSEKTGSNYIFFLIAGIEYFKVWVGDYSNYKILEIHEVERNGALYVKK